MKLRSESYLSKVKHQISRQKNVTIIIDVECFRFLVFFPLYTMMFKKAFPPSFLSNPLLEIKPAL